MSKKKKKKQKISGLQSVLIFIIFALIFSASEDVLHFAQTTFFPSKSYAISDIPLYQGSLYVTIHDNIPEFTEEDYQRGDFEEYSSLDSLGRCGVAFANVSVDTMPKEERGSIGMIKPSGWQTVKYDFVDGKYLYNRCHLIGFQLTGENANPNNLITCTRSMNTKGMTIFENQVADYVKKTKHHVLYRVTPIFSGTNLVSSGVQMEAYSLEDHGEGISFNVFVYNVEEGVSIHYSDGSSEEET